MLKRLNHLRRWAGVDRAVFFSNAAQMLRLITGPITMFLVLRHLTPEIQGYAYVFVGVVAAFGCHAVALFLFANPLEQLKETSENLR